MTEEIKEILGRLQDSVNYPKIDMPTFDGSDSEYINNDTLLEPSKCKLLLNYITNLQKERDIYKQRNEKSVELIRKSLIESDITGNGTLDLSNLLNILQGGDE